MAGTREEHSGVTSRPTTSARWMQHVLTAVAALATLVAMAAVPVACTVADQHSGYERIRLRPAPLCAAADAASPRIAAALALLRRIDPQSVAYVQERQVRISELTTTELESCFPAHGQSFGLTDANGRVFVNGSRATSDRLVAAVVAHELVHDQHGDSGHQLSHHDERFHWWFPEEAEAHGRGADAALTLGAVTTGVVASWMRAKLERPPVLIGVAIAASFVAALALTCGWRVEAARPASRSRCQGSSPVA